MIPTHYQCPCNEACPLHYAMSIIGGKWKVQILCTLNQGRLLRYNSLQRKLDGISSTVLSKALKELEEDGLVHRKETLEVPIKVEYSTSQKCDKLIPILDALSDWAEDFYQENTHETNRTSS